MRTVVVFYFIVSVHPVVSDVEETRNGTENENYEEGKGASRGNIGNETGNSPGKHYGNNEQTVSQQETVE